MYIHTDLCIYTYIYIFQIFPHLKNISALLFTVIFTMFSIFFICLPPCVSNICLFFQHVLCFPNIVVRMFFFQYVTVPPYFSLYLPYVSICCPLCFHMLMVPISFLEMFPSYCDVDFLAPKWAKVNVGGPFNASPAKSTLDPPAATGTVGWRGWRG